jgi:hypothetical protein
MARKVFIAYIVYVAVVFLVNTYLLKEQFTDAIVKAVLSGVVFTMFYYIILARQEKRKDEEKK